MWYTKPPTRRITMWKLTCLLLLLCQLHLGSTQFDFASQIFKSVHDSLQNTQNLGSQIHQRVQQQLANAFQGFGANFMNLHHDLGNQISQSIGKQFASIHSMGARIQDDINRSLLPVHALKIKSDMANGIGGTTIATYGGMLPRIFVIKNGIRQVCNGNVDGPNCYGILEPFEIRNKQDFCYARTYANVNDKICLAAGSISVQSLNNQVMCYADGAPLLQLTQPEYQQLCGMVSPGQAIYRYYSDPNDPTTIPIPNSNPYIKCLNNEPGVCAFEAPPGGTGSGSHISSTGFNFVQF